VCVAACILYVVDLSEESVGNLTSRQSSEQPLHYISSLPRSVISRGEGGLVIYNPLLGGC
jgi:hypothetical protein